MYLATAIEMAHGELKLKNHSHWQLFLFSLPSILAVTLGSFASVVDTALVGQLRTDWLGALGPSIVILNGFSWAFIFLIHTTVQGISSASSEVSSRVVKERVQISLLTAIAGGTLASLLIWSVRYWIYPLAGAEGELIPIVESYFSIRILGHPFLIIYITTISILRGLGRVNCSFFLIFFTTVFNIALTYFFLYQMKTDLGGAAWGTVLSNALGTLLSLIIILRHPSLRGVWRKYYARKKNWLLFRKNGRDIFLRNACLTLVFFLSNTLAAKQGVVVLAAHQVILQIYLLASYCADGIATSAIIIGANYYAKRRMEELRLVYGRILHLGAFVGAIFALIYLFLGHELVSLFSGDREVIALVLSIMPLFYLTQVVSSVTFTYDGLMSGLGEFPYLRFHVLLGTLTCFFPLVIVGYYSQSLGWIWGGIVALNFYRTLLLGRRNRQILCS